MSSIVVAGDTSGTVTLQAPAVAGTTTLTLPSTSGTVMAPSSVGTSGQYLQSTGSSTPTWATLNVSGTLLNIQYFTTAGTATYTPTAGTNFVIVEVVGGGGGTTGAGGTSSFGALVSATGGATATTTSPGAAGGAGSGGDLNISGCKGMMSGAYQSGNKCTAGGIPSMIGSYGVSTIDYQSASTTAVMATSAGNGGYARKKITSSFSGVTVTVGAAGTGTAIVAATSGIVIVYEYA